MSARFLASNAVKLLLLLPILFGAPQIVKAMCVAGLILSLVVDYLFYRRDKAMFEDEDDTRVEPVPLPPGHAARRKR